MALNENLLIKIEELELPIRSAVCLRNEKNIFYVGDLVQKTKKDLLKIPNFGKKSLFWVERTLAEMGLNLGMTTLPEIVKWPPECIKREIWRLEDERNLAEASKIFVEELKKKMSTIEQELLEVKPPKIDPYEEPEWGRIKGRIKWGYTYKEQLLNQNLIEIRTVLQSVNLLNLDTIEDLIRMKTKSLECVLEEVKKARKEVARKC